MNKSLALLKKEINSAPFLNVWIAFNEDASSIVAFQSEISALRYAIRKQPMKVRPLHDGVNIFAIIDAARNREELEEK